MPDETHEEYVPSESQKCAIAECGFDARPDIYGTVSGAAVSTNIVTPSPGGALFDNSGGALTALNSSSIDPAISLKGLNNQATRGYNDFDFLASKGQLLDGQLLDVSDSRVVYGKSNTVTPPNISAIPIMKAL